MRSWSCSVIRSEPPRWASAAVGASAPTTTSTRCSSASSASTRSSTRTGAGRWTELQLGVYVDGIFQTVETATGPRVASVPESYAFCLFACAVGEHFDRLSFFGRAGEAEELLPPGPELVPLPFYPSL